MKRILHLIDTTGPGGAETVFLTLLKSLGPGWEGIPVLSGPGWVEDSVRNAGLSPLRISLSRGPDIGYLASLMKAIRRHRIDLVQTHFVSPALYGGLAARLRGIPAVGTFHGTRDIADIGWRSRFRYGLVRAGCSRVVCVSTSLRDRALSTGWFKPGDLEVIPNGVDTSLFAPGDGAPARRKLGIPPGVFLVGAVGNMRAPKDYSTLLRTAAKVRERAGDSVHFVIVGQRTPPLSTELSEQRAQMELEDTVTFAGFRDDIPDVLRAFDVFLLTSLHEGFSLVTVQAMATGLPVVATRCGGPEEIVTPESDGVLCPTRDPDALASAILSLQAVPSVREGLGRKARETAIARFSEGAMVRGYEQVYGKVLACGPGAG